MNGPCWDLTDYRLTPQQNEDLFREEIVPDLLAGKPSREQPIAVVVIGQPGSGKTRAGQQVGERLGPGEYVIADSDLYKPHHPAYESLLRDDDRLLSSATRHDGRLWMAKAQRYAREHRLDVLIDHTVDDLDYFRQTLRPYHQAGYRVAAYLLAVPEAAAAAEAAETKAREEAEQTSLLVAALRRRAPTINLAVTEDVRYSLLDETPTETATFQANSATIAMSVRSARVSELGQLGRSASRPARSRVTRSGARSHRPWCCPPDTADGTSPTSGAASKRPTPLCPP